MGDKVSFLDLFDLPDVQQEILLYITRNGPADRATLVRATGLDAAEVDRALQDLARSGRVRLAGEQWDAVIGRAKGRATLPAHICNALLTTDRLYSEQEIATLRTAIPILQLARARLAEFADHGSGHSLRVKSFAAQLGCLVGLSVVERDLLRAAALFHDVGNIVDRGRHHIISQETVLRLTADGALPFTPHEAELVGLLCRWHRREYDPARSDELHGRIVRTGLLASVLRVADAMDIDHRRSDYTTRWSEVIHFFFPDKGPYWTSLEEILGVRIHATPAVELEVFARGDFPHNMQVEMLREDLADTPFPWTLRQIAVHDEGAARPAGQPCAAGDGPALLAFPFEPHSVVMAALSRKHLAAAGYGAELLCYPDTAGGPHWLWGQTLPEMDPRHYRRLVVIGDRADPALTLQLLRTVERWREAGVAVSVLNRYEANWTRLPSLLERGAEVVLGSDWTYFWGEPADRADLAWGRIAGLCTRDPAQSTVGLKGEEMAVTEGLLKTVYDAALQPPSDTAGWAALVQPILERIEDDDRAFFRDQATGFADCYGSAVQPGRIEGHVLLLDVGPGHPTQRCYWALEAAIEQQGRSPERGLHFKVPYAIATWRDGDMVELLAMNHWREEEAIPIRLLYPGDLGPPPAGNEGTLLARLPAAQAERVVQALLEACNRQDVAGGAAGEGRHGVAG